MDRWLLLDIDGTLSPMGHIDAAEDVITASGAACRAVVRSDIASMLQRASSLVRLGWYSAWEEQANVDLAHRLGLGPLPFVPLADGVDEPSVLKADGLVRWEHYSPAGRYVIVDDDLHAVEGSLPQNVLLIAVDSRRGIEQHHVDRGLSWLMSTQ